MNTDAELLTRFAATGDEGAFREIVERHAPMVQGVVWRRTQDRALTEEITQIVFTILVRKAAGLRHSELAGWLHRAAFMETRNACRKEARRGEALRELTNHMTGDTNEDNAWQDIQPHLDEALTRLPADERQLVVMRYFEQRSYREIADTTGKTEEASRKRMQRSLDRLGALLRRKGIATSGAALGALLAGQSLCVPSASAALITSAALHGAPAVTASTLFTHTLFTMTASTILKTSIVTIALAAIPLTILWRENSSLKEEVSELRRASATTIAARPAIATATASRATSPEVSKPEAHTSGQKKAPEDPAAAIAGMLGGENLIKMAGEQMKQEASREVNRLALRLHLTPEQKEKLAEFLENKHRAGLELLEQAVSTGLLTRAMKGKDSLSEEDQKKLADMEAAEKTGEELDPFLGKMLTPEQLVEYGKSKEEKRVAEAEEHAHQTLSEIGKDVDLTEDQKDRLFQALAQKKLSVAPEARAGAAESVNIADTLSQSDRSSDDVLRSILTAEQFQTYEKSREEEERRTKEMMKLVAPWMPGQEAAAAK